ncbi:MAG: HEPN domain-containing protein [Treponema sp.]|nr:HEPN domain-containing protein [Treponema sp.]
MSLTAEDKYQYWLSYARNDMESAEIMLKGGRWFYTQFMCQQAIEKQVKGLYILYIDDNVPRLHDINSILDRFKDNFPETLTDGQISLFDTLSQFYLRSRYPDYTSALASFATRETAQSIYEKSKEAFEWLLTMKPHSK